MGAPTYHTEQLGRQEPPSLYGQYPVLDAAREVIRPLADRLIRDAQRLRSRPNSPSEQIQRDGFLHSAGLNHSSVSFATIVPAVHAQSATMVEGEDYGERLQIALRRAQMTAAGLASKLGVTYQAVKKALDGKSTLSTPNNAMAARHLGVRSDWLALGDGAMAAAPAEREGTEPVVLNTARSFAGTPMTAALDLWNATRTTSSSRRKALMNLLEELLEAETDHEARDIARRIEALLAPAPAPDQDVANG